MIQLTISTREKPMKTSHPCSHLIQSSIGMYKKISICFTMSSYNIKLRNEKYKLKRVPKSSLLQDYKEAIKHTYSIPRSSNALIEIVALRFHPNFWRLLNIVSNKQPQYKSAVNLINSNVNSQVPNITF